ncbi:ribonuclease H-like domain-containing protein [Tanacetum coccineum]
MMSKHAVTTPGFSESLLKFLIVMGLRYRQDVLFDILKVVILSKQDRDGHGLMKNSWGKGRIINIVSKVGWDGDVWQVNYRATKGGVITFTEGAAKEYSESGINSKDGGPVMAQLPVKAQRHPWLRYQVEGYTKEIVNDFERRLDTIFSRQVNRVHILDFEGLTVEMRPDLAYRLRMVYTGSEGQVLFTSDAWRRLFEIRGPLVREFMIEFFSTCRISDTEMGLHVRDTLYFQLGGARRSMTRRHFILALGLHTAKEMAWGGFEAYWLGSTRAIPNKGGLRAYWTRISSDGEFLGVAPSYTLIRDPLRRLFHRLISFSISGIAQAPEKVTATDLFYLRSMDEGTANVPYLLCRN